jgi:FtsP/CotA-like multicopper oxidase with cupredoxin domain
MTIGVIHRREFLSALAIGLAFPRVGVAQDAPQTLRVEKAKAQILGAESPPTDVWRFVGEAGQPILRAKQGQPFTCRVVNTLDRELWLHFFGLRGPAEMTTVQVPMGGEASAVTVSFTPPDAGTFWFSTMLDQSRMRDMGLSGVLIVEEAQPLIDFVDVPLVLDDWMIDDNGKIDADFGSLERAIGEGRIGRWFTVNGQYKPRIDISRTKNNRLRLLNASNARSFAVVFNNVDLIVIAEDGQPVLPRPLGLEPLVIAPGQRLDLLVGEVQDQAVLAFKLEEDTVEAAFLLASGAKGEGVAENFALLPNPVSPLPQDDLAYRPVTLTLEGGADGGLKSAKVGLAELDLRQLLEKGLAWAINGIAGVGGPMLFTAKSGEILFLTIDNKTAFEQVLHLHGHVWALVERAGVKTTSVVWRDTVVVDAKNTVKVVMVADNPGSWAIQSLHAERSDAGLLGGFKVGDMP